jgi:hypothetical protein
MIFALRIVGIAALAFLAENAADGPLGLSAAATFTKPFRGREYCNRVVVTMKRRSTAIHYSSPSVGGRAYVALLTHHIDQCV